jgi:hypothetical protein
MGLIYFPSFDFHKFKTRNSKQEIQNKKFKTRNSKQEFNLPSKFLFPSFGKFKTRNSKTRKSKTRNLKQEIQKQEI